MTPPFTVYIDESGDEGFRFRDPPEPKGSSDWFVLTALIAPAARDNQVRAIADIIRRRLELAPKATLHFSELNHERRVKAINTLRVCPFHCTSVLIDKRNIAQPDIFQEAPFRLYFYATRLLLERISWFCRDFDNRRFQNGPPARIIFEHRRRLSYDRLKDYIDVLNQMARTDDWLRMLNNAVRIHWPLINRDNIEAAQKHQYAGLQIADLLAGSLRTALEPSRYGETEHRFAKTLEPLVYRRNGNCLSYGLKFFPEPPPTGGNASHWIDKHYR